MSSIDKWEGSNSTRQEVFQAITSTPTEQSDTSTFIQVSFLDSNDANNKNVITKRTQAPSGRPERNGPLPCDLEIGLERHNGYHLIPKRVITNAMDTVLYLDNPIQSASQLISIFDRNYVDFFNTLFSLKGDLSSQPPLLGISKQVEDIKMLLEGESSTFRNSMLYSISSFRTFLEWLSNPGYDFVFAPSGIPDHLVKDGEDIVDISGGRCDSLGVNIEGDNYMEILEAVQRKRYRSVPKLLEFCRSRGVSISNIDVLEFKLGSRSEIRPGEGLVHSKQISKYTNLLSVITDIPVTGKLIYFGKNLDITSVLPDVRGKWIEEELSKVRENGTIVDILEREREMKKAIYSVAFVKNPDVIVRMVERVLSRGKVNVLELIALSHFKGAEMMDDGSIAIYLPNDMTIVVRDGEAVCGDVVMRVFSNNEYTKEAKYDNIIAGFNSWGKRLGRIEAIA
ncbi:MAG: hypothetical protein AB9915_02935 [Candidatus Dojkabacteria bacterium]